ncbi:MAG: low-specificity L-threonine aldolase [Deltaproteobacteria bacterium]|nr:low-specificity L-threonine aldolase [Deltaproteobacteria bacterium]
MRLIDLRSDTVTLPTEEMRAFMAKAEVGDDVFGEDPSVNKLQEMVADLLGKEAALFVASGTMGNEISIKILSNWGDEVIVEQESHIFNYEVGVASAFFGVQLSPIKGIKGVFTSEQVKDKIRPENIHFPRTKVICIENTHNRGGGNIFPLDEIERIKKIADKYKLKMHLDGARLFNASVATKIPLKEYSKFFDTVTICLSKGLAAPVGSVIAGDKPLIDEARRIRKMMGGGMRQAGIIAAAGIYALEHHLERLEEDHYNASLLAKSIADIKGIKIDPNDVKTNIVIFEVTDTRLSAQEVIEKLLKNGIKMLLFKEKFIRAVTHLGIEENDIRYTSMVLDKIFSG